MMRAAEKLIAAKGVENISIREIVTNAGQKNESALQYHFKNLSGLLKAIHEERSAQVQAERASMLTTLKENTPSPSLREVCSLMVGPTFTLARNDVSFRRYVKAFGHQLAISEVSPLKMATQGGAGGSSGHQLSQLLRDTLPQCDDETYRRRLEAAITLCSASMYQQATKTNAFRGQQSDLFLNHLLDALVGLLSAPVSSETLSLTEQS